MPSFCRNCLTTFDTPGRCPACRSPRTLSHPELFELSVAHMDCDAFYASVEKRDNPDLRELPVIVGGGRRGVVTTACYIARIRGVRSAMPMFKALQLCPEAVVVKPRFDAYVAASRAIRAMMDELTPIVEPLSLDEAFLDLSGTTRLHGAPPAVLLARLVQRMETGTGPLGLHRPESTTSFSPRSPRIWTSRAVSRSSAKPRRRHSSATSRCALSGVSAPPRRRRWTAPASAPSPTCCAGIGAISTRASGAPAIGSGTWPAETTGVRVSAHAPITRPVERDDLRCGHLRPRPARRPSLAPRRKARRPRKGQGRRRARRDAETQARRSLSSDPAPCAARADPTGRPDISRSAGRCWTRSAATPPID